MTTELKNAMPTHAMTHPQLHKLLSNVHFHPPDYRNAVLSSPRLPYFFSVYPISPQKRVITTNAPTLSS